MLYLTKHMDDTQLQKKTKPKTTTKNKTIESKTKNRPTQWKLTSCMGSLTSHQFMKKEDALTMVVPLKNLSVMGTGGPEPFLWVISFGKTYQLDTITTEYLHQTLVFLGHQLGPLRPQHPSEKKNTIKEMSTKKEPLLISNLQYAGVIRGVRRELTVFPFSPVGPAAPAGPSGPCGKKNADMTSNQQWEEKIKGAA